VVGATCPLCRQAVPSNIFEHAQSNITSNVHDLDIDTNTDSDYYTSSDSDDDNVIIEEKPVQHMTIYQWFYQGRNHGMWAYDNVSNRKINKLYAQYQKDPSNYDPTQHIVQISTLDFVIDFANMVQISLKYNSQRKIVNKIDPTIPVKGRAGIRL